jgi:hypothetical protein
MIATPTPEVAPKHYKPKINIWGVITTISLLLQKKTGCFAAVSAAKHPVFLFFARP